MSDIWDEKPESGQWASFKYPVKEGESLKLPIYDAEKMDAWLEKLLGHYTKELCWQQDRFMKVNEKLEAVRKLAEDLGPCYQSDRFLEVLLGDSWFTTNSEEVKDE